MGSAGESAATAAALKQALNKFEAFRKSTPELGAAYPVPFVDLGDTIMCDRTVWKRFAQYITYDYVIAEGNQNSGKHLSLDVLVSTLRKLIHKAKAQHETKSVANRQFFTCVDQYSSSDDAKWLSGLVHTTCAASPRSAALPTETRSTRVPRRSTSRSSSRCARLSSRRGRPSRCTAAWRSLRRG